MCANFAHTTRHGAIEGKQQTKEVVLYNLDVIISVGYRVKSKRGTAFRIWARKIIKDYLVKGFAVNERIRGIKTINVLCQNLAVVSPLPPVPCGVARRTYHFAESLYDQTMTVLTAA